MCSWQAVVMRLRITQGAEGLARISKATRLSGGCLFVSNQWMVKKNELKNYQKIKRDLYCSSDFSCILYV